MLPVSVGPVMLHTAGFSEEDWVPPALELLERVHKAVWARPFSAPRCSVPGDSPVLVMLGRFPKGQ